METGVAQPVFSFWTVMIFQGIRRGVVFGSGNGMLANSPAETITLLLAAMPNRLHQRQPTKK